MTIRAEAVTRRLLKSEVRECIIAHVHRNCDGSDIDLRSCVEYTPSWQKYVRRCQNNLGLKLHRKI